MTDRIRSSFRAVLVISIREAISVYFSENYSAKGTNVVIVNDQRHALADKIAIQLTEDFRLRRFAKILDTRFKRRPK